MTAESDNAASEHDPQEVQSVTASSMDTMNIALKCVLRDDLETLVASFEDREDEEEPLADKMPELIQERDELGKSPLDIAATLGRSAIAKELITRGVEANEATSNKGYGAIHFAAAWGRIDCLKALIEIGCDLHLKTSNNERAREIALRYNQSECVDFLDWAEARQALVSAITNMKETVTDPEKVQGRLARDEKNSTLALCNEKSEWVENTTDATTQDFITQKEEFDNALADVVLKLSAPPPEKPEKK